VLQLAVDLRFLDKAMQKFGLALVSLEQHFDGDFAAQVGIKVGGSAPGSRSLRGGAYWKLVPSDFRTLAPTGIGGPDSSTKASVGLETDESSCGSAILVSGGSLSGVGCSGMQ
jgi:hypothetical protein